MPQRPTTRRKFLKQSALGLTLPLLPGIARGYPANSRLRHAAVGVGGMGRTDLTEISSSPHVEIVALCDIDDRHLDAAAEKHPGAKRYNDFRILLDREDKNIDSCNVTVPDHMHGPIAMTAIRRGKHVYCQKPLCHEIDETRKLRLAASKAGVVTQMGIQIHSHSVYRTAVKAIRDGRIGKVRAVHTWADRRWTNAGRPQPSEPPAEVHWDLWLGVAPSRPGGLSDTGTGAYHPKKWWSWMDFGTGNLGDMGCHLIDPVVAAVNLGPPKQLRAECRPPRKETWPNEGAVFFEFSATEHTTEPLTWTWYDGGFQRGHHPPRYLVSLPVPLAEGEDLPSQGSIFIGEKGVLLLPHVNAPRLLPQEAFCETQLDVLPTENHWHSFVDACRGEGKTEVHFDYAGPLTETVLLGNVAKRFPSQTLRWDAESLRVTNFSDANNFLRYRYREGWEIAGLS